MKSQNMFGDKYGADLDAFIKTNSPETLLDRKRDLASHFILRAAYCSTGEQRRWFLTQECALFRHRLEALMKIPAAFKRFLENVGITFERVDDAEKERLRAKLVSCPLGDSSSSHASLDDFSKTMFYKIPFIQALDLVRSRLVYVEGGYVYVPTLR
jgi:DNA primase large subunit